MQPLPIGIQTLRKIVDKTKQIYPLIEKSGAYFLTRPRRFGKSLILSVLEEIFSANKELFRGLWIYDSNYQWKKYPILRFDFSKQKAQNKEELIQFIFNELKLNAEKNKVQLVTTAYFTQVEELIQKTGQNEKVVILINEYDKPLLII